MGKYDDDALDAMQAAHLSAQQDAAAWELVDRELARHQAEFDANGQQAAQALMRVGISPTVPTPNRARPDLPAYKWQLRLAPSHYDGQSIYMYLSADGQWIKPFAGGETGVVLSHTLRPNVRPPSARADGSFDDGVVLETSTPYIGVRNGLLVVAEVGEPPACSLDDGIRASIRALVQDHRGTA